MTELSASTQLAVLLTARWAINGSQPLTNSEFAEVRRALGPGQDGAQALLNRRFGLGAILLEQARIEGLLDRGLGVFQKVDRWLQAGLWIASWADADYPERFKQLKQRAPVLLFGYGNPNAFSRRALAIVGSRSASDDRLSMAAEIGRACSANEITVVSGGARGVDSYAMGAGAVGNGTVVGVLADSLLKASAKKEYRDAIMDGRMCLMSEVHPEARFDVGSAMARNRLAYACADAALVVECDPNKGGTWAGALDALKEGKAVYVIQGAKAERELVQRGAVRISLEFALEPQRLIAGERPEQPIPEIPHLISAVREMLGNPARERDELVIRIREHPEDFVDKLLAAALHDGVLEATPRLNGSSASGKKRGSRAPKESKAANRSLFEP